MSDYRNNLMFHDLELHQIPSRFYDDANLYINYLLKKHFRSDPVDNGKFVEAGQTYFGQFIAHDLVPSTNLHIDRSNVTPSLNLECIYGNAVFGLKYLSSHFFDENGFFKLAKVESSENGKDFIRRENPHNNEYKLALVPDQRNDENIIVCQFHILWLRFHNAILADLRNESQFKKLHSLTLAMQIVRKTYHMLIRNTFMAQLMHPKVMAAYPRKEKFKSLLLTKYQNSRVPLEFSHAAFRFGHSMVRNEYNLQKNQGAVKLPEILSRAKNKINHDDVIDWEFFFQRNAINSNFFNSIKAYGKEINFSDESTSAGRRSASAANLINTTFPYLFRVPIEEKHLDLRKINLLAALKKPSATYNQIYEILSESKNKTAEIFHVPKEKLNHENFCEPPLWVSILCEAGLREDGRLGKIGSFIVMETLLKAIDYANKNEEFLIPESESEEYIYDKVFSNERVNFKFGHFIDYIEARESL